MAVLIFWVLTGAVLAFIALAIYGARLADKPPAQTPYGKLVLQRYEKERTQIIEKELAKAMDSMRAEFYIVPKAAR